MGFSLAGCTSSDWIPRWLGALCTLFACVCPAMGRSRWVSKLMNVQLLLCLIDAFFTEKSLVIIFFVSREVLQKRNWLQTAENFRSTVNDPITASSVKRNVERRSSRNFCLAIMNFRGDDFCGYCFTQIQIFQIQTFQISKTFGISTLQAPVPSDTVEIVTAFQVLNENKFYSWTLFYYFVDRLCLGWKSGQFFSVSLPLKIRLLKSFK